MKTLEELQKLPPDAYSRYFIVTEVLKEAFGNKEISVLDVGGKETLLPDFFEVYKLPFKLTVIDILPEKKKDKRYRYIQCDATAMDFADGDFEAVVSTDVLEHILDEKKDAFVDECLRVAKDLIIIAAPFDSPEVDQAEHVANDFFKRYMGTDHPWLKEHFEANKPKREWLVGKLEKAKIEFTEINSNYLENWLIGILPNFFRVKYSENHFEIDEFNRFYNQNLSSIGDFKNPAYRNIVIALKSKEIKLKQHLFSGDDNFEFKANLLKRAKEIFSDAVLEQEERISVINTQKNDLGELANKLNDRLEKLHLEIISERERSEKLIKHTENLQSTLANITNSKTFKIWQAAVLSKRLGIEIVKNPKKIKKIPKIIAAEGISGIKGRLRAQQRAQGFNDQVNELYKRWLVDHFPRKKELSTQNLQANKFKQQPLISLITPTYNTDAKFLREMIESVVGQSYPKWQLCLADDKSTDPEVRKIIKEYADRDTRIKYVFRKTNGHISAASNSALKLATGEFVGLLDHDDYLWPNALFEVVKLLQEKPDTDFIYSDEDKIAEDGVAHVDPFFKPDWSPDYFRSFNYITHFSVIRKSLVDIVGGFRIGYEGTQDWDLFLRIVRQTDKIAHIDKILYSWRISETSTASAAHAENAKDYAYQNQKKALEDDLGERRLKAEVSATKYLGLWQINYELAEKPLVSLIIPTKDNFEMLKSLLESFKKKTKYENFEVIVVDTGSKSPDTETFYKQNLSGKMMKLDWKQDFNFAAVCNIGAKKAKGDYLVFLNDDTEVKTGDWLEKMLMYAMRPNVGAVGPKLLYPDGRIQHAGMVLIDDWWPHHYKISTDENEPLSFPIIYFRDAVRNTIAVTGACLMVGAEKFRDVEGFDESFEVEYNDVDLCLKLNHLGYGTIYTPFVKLVHHESISISKEEKKHDWERIFKYNRKLLDKYPGLIDPFFNQEAAKVDPELIQVKKSLKEIKSNLKS